MSISRIRAAQDLNGAAAREESGARRRFKGLFNSASFLASRGNREPPSDRCSRRRRQQRALLGCVHDVYLGQHNKRAGRESGPQNLPEEIHTREDSSLPPPSRAPISLFDEYGAHMERDKGTE